MQNIPNNIPATYYSSSPPPVQKKERGALFTTVLVLSTIGRVIGTLVLAFGGAAVDEATQGASVHHSVAKLVAFSVVLQVAALISVCGIWVWKKWALAGYFVTSALLMLASYKMTGSFSTTSLIWPGLMLVGVFPRFHMFED